MREAGSDGPHHSTAHVQNMQLDLHGLANGIVNW